MADHSDLNPANLKPGAVSGSNLKPGLVTDAYTSGTPASAGQIKPSLRTASGQLKPGLVSAGALKPSLSGTGIVPVAPTNVEAPNVTGTNEVDSILTCDPGTWTGSPTFTYQWYADDVLIVGAESNTYPLTSDELDAAEVYCEVTGTNGAGSNAADSNIVGPIGPPNYTVTLTNGSSVVDQFGNFIVNTGHLLILLALTIEIVVEDGAGNPRSLTAADIDEIGFYQRFDGVQATTMPTLFDPTDVSVGSPWESGGIYNNPGGTLNIHLPYVAAVGDPDEIEIYISVLTGSVHLPNPIVAV